MEAYFFMVSSRCVINTENTWIFLFFQVKVIHQNLSIYIKISCLSMCLSTDVMFVCRLTSCLSTDVSIYLYISSIYIKISCLSVCVSGDVMFLCRLTSCFRLTKLRNYIGTQMTTRTPAHREYKWRPGHSKRKRPGHKECSISNHHQQSTGTEMTTGTQGV